VVDDLSTGSRANIEPLQQNRGFRFVADSCSNPGIMAELIANCDGVFHLAGVVGVRRVLESPLRTLITNVSSTETVLAVASEHGKPVLVTSTSEVYGKAGAMPLREDADLNIGSPDNDRWSYACSKAANEFLAMAYWKEKRLPVVIVRLFNTVGPRQTGRYGMVIPTFVRQGLDGTDITVFGDGHQSRFFVHVADVVGAMMTLLKSATHVGQVYNIGSDRQISILALAERIRDLTGKRSRVVLLPYEQAYGTGFQEPMQRVPDLSKLNGAIGWMPRRDLQQILTDVVNHLRG